MTVAVCLIVKNEAKTIGRCLDSIRGMVDAVVIVDTGSTDGTVELLRSMEYPVPIHVHQRPWVHFAHNRTEMLQLASFEADYLLLLDADRTVTGKIPTSLTADSYSPLLHYGNLAWHHPSLIRSALPWRYEGVVHEYLVCEQAGPSVNTNDFSLIEHLDGGGRAGGSHPRWEWDAMILEQELAKGQINPRYVFYLARTYEDLSNTRPNDPQASIWRKRAEARYRERAAMTIGYADEAFYSLFRLGVMRLNEPDGLQLLLEAWQRCPNRWEPLHEACRWLNERGLYFPSYSLSKQAIGMGSTPDGLFAQPSVYEYLLPFEHSISAYYVGNYQESIDWNRRLLARQLPQHIEDAVKRNIEYPLAKLREMDPASVRA